MSSLQQETEFYEKKLSQQVNNVVEKLKLKNILAGLRNFFRNQFWRRRTLYALGAAAVVYMLLRGAMGSSRRVRVLTADGSGGGTEALVVEQKAGPGFWARLIQDAVRTFLLAYARKLLMDYMSRNKEGSAA